MKKMKVYKGVLDPEGPGGVRVTVDGKPLKPIQYFLKVDFRWGDGAYGSGNLAYSILMDYLDNAERARFWQNDFKWDIISNLPRDKWVIREREIKQWIKDWLGEHD